MTNPEQSLLPQNSGAWDEMFSDEFGTVWIIKGDRTAEQALALAVEAEGADAEDSPTVTAQRGRIDARNGEPWFTLDPKGDTEVWQVAW